MATAFATVKTITTCTSVDLYLSPMEARFLLNVLSRIGGSPSKSGREYADSILQALRGGGNEEAIENATAKPGLSKPLRVDESLGSSIYFKDYDK